MVVCFTIFRCENIGIAREFLASTGAPAGKLPPSLDWCAVVLVLGAAHWVIFRHKAALKRRVESSLDWVFYPALGVATALLLSLTPAKSAPFIYFQF